MTLDEMIRAVQGALDVTVDGKAGPQTWEAIYKRIINKKPPVSEPVDARSEKNIATLHPKVQPHARALVQRASDHGIAIKVISGTRTFEEQNELFAQGRTKPGNIVTNARGGFSNHNFGIAFDIGVFEGSAYRDESPKYKAVGAVGQELGLDWGGNWKTIQDEPHFQLRPDWALDLTEKEMLTELRARVAAGKDAFA